MEKKRGIPFLNSFTYDYTNDSISSLLDENNFTSENLENILKQNQNLSETEKNFIRNHVHKIEEYDASFDFRIYFENLKELKIKSIDSSRMNQITTNVEALGTFEYKDKTIYLLDSIDEEKRDGVLSHELLHMSNIYYEDSINTTTQKLFTLEQGFGIGLLECLNSNYNEKIGYDDYGYDVSKQWADLLCNIIGEQELFDIYQEQNIKQLYQKLVAIDPDEDKALKLIGLFDIIVRGDVISTQNLKEVRSLLYNYYKQSYKTKLSDDKDICHFQKYQSEAFKFQNSLNYANAITDNYGGLMEDVTLGDNKFVTEDLSEFIYQWASTLGESYPELYQEDFKFNIQQYLNGNFPNGATTDYIFISQNWINGRQKNNSENFTFSFENIENLYLVYGKNPEIQEMVCVLTQEAPVGELFVPSIIEGTVCLDVPNIPTALHIEKVVPLKTLALQHNMDLQYGTIIDSKQLIDYFLNNDYTNENHRSK